jgi:uncharacterized protein HemY
MIERLLAGEAALARDELDAAERLFTQVATADPRNAIALVGLARIAVRRGDRDGARVLADRALAIDPDEAAATRLLAELDRPRADALEPSTVPQVQQVPRPGRAPGRLPRAAKTGWRAWLARLLRRG